MKPIIFLLFQMVVPIELMVLHFLFGVARYMGLRGNQGSIWVSIFGLMLLYAQLFL